MTDVYVFNKDDKSDFVQVVRERILCGRGRTKSPNAHVKQLNEV